MKNTGIIRQIDELGRIVLPKELRTTLEIDPGTPLEIHTEEDYIMLKKHKQNIDCCIFCGGDVSLIEFKGKLICKVCKNRL